RQNQILRKSRRKRSRKEREESPEEKIAKLKEQMSEAVEKQEFEQAAKLRDEIRALEGEING
ncbi:MAG: UvrB/UvrC motif-containing protein, partial [Clostridia bacterium]|nr:UvrB/UvrC motif-containing protein [Clostridia bacterium]